MSADQIATEIAQLTGKQIDEVYEDTKKKINAKKIRQLSMRLEKLMQLSTPEKVDKKTEKIVKEPKPKQVRIKKDKVEGKSYIAIGDLVGDTTPVYPSD